MSQWIAVQTPQGARVVQAGYVGPAGTTLPAYTVDDIGKVLGVVDNGSGAPVLAWVTSGSSTGMSLLDFSNANNSGYYGSVV